MANLLPRNKPISRGRLFASSAGDPQQETDVYNRSSLALDPETSAPHKHSGSHVVEWPHPVAALAPEGAIWKGLDPFAVKRSKASSVISFILHAVIIGAVLYLGLRFRVVIPAAT
jgi:hypothetical protein